jgi:hypothetical protein
MEDLQQAIDFINDLYLLSMKDDIEELPLASEACISANELINNIEQRLLKLKQVSCHFSQLDIFLSELFEPLWNEIKEISYAEWPSDTREHDLPKDMQTLSPSDFGFHNALRRIDGSLCFLDFEYFGWDDPVKLIADFIWHPAMELQEPIKEIWVKSTLENFSRDKNIPQRFHAALPLFGLRWVMIILNEYLAEGFQRRTHAGKSRMTDWDWEKTTQLKKAIDLTRKIKSNQYINVYV